MKKAEGAFLTISELAGELGLPQHILRYWETRFPQLRPLQRSGNRRYYRPDDVALARRIHHLLHVEGFTVKGAQKALADGEGAAGAAPADAPAEHLVVRLEGIRAALAAALKL
ncbi:MAG TPA: MerR family transcriptional regulator [Sphingobium sp.]|uniref:MerR family transcriptional regulator n=1 Tax=Sphingobium sp. TaxID=1912891 RepID=UPI000EBC5B7D|nr:MerR family transcriptional regulator [Sphingobium sp.]HAF42077.1 MerR family transcriptional regulator [Sphingobium sp.]